MFKYWQTLPSWLRLSLLFPLLCLNGFLLVVILSYLEPFVSFLIIATLLAFLLELLVKVLEQRGMRRGVAIATVLLATLLMVVLLGFIIFPIMIKQLTDLIYQAPEWIEGTTKSIQNFSQSPLARRFSLDVNEILAQGIKRLSTALESVGSQALGVVLGTITSAINTVIILILTIFLLVGGDRFWDGIFSWLPSPWDRRVRDYTVQTFKDYFFSRALLAFVSSIARTVIFLLLGVPYSLLFAFGIGLTSLIPFVAGILILLTTILLAFKSVALGLKFFVAAIIIDQVTDNVVAPRLMGEITGLNPVWLLISLFIGGKIAGILGLLLAVPLASIIKRIVDDIRAGNTTSDAVILVEEQKSSNY